MPYINFFWSYRIAVPIFRLIGSIAYAKFKVSRMWRQCQFEGKCVVDDVSSASTNDLWESANGVGLWFPAVPARSNEHFFVEAEIFHLYSSNDSRFRFLDDDILERNVTGFQFTSERK